MPDDTPLIDQLRASFALLDQIDNTLDLLEDAPNENPRRHSRALRQYFTGQLRQRECLLLDQWLSHDATS
jgi:non-ribosomal peptide synthetase component F